MMEKRYQEALNKVLMRLKAEYRELTAVFLAGSVVRGEGSATSDLD